MPRFTYLTPFWTASVKQTTGSFWHLAKERAMTEMGSSRNGSFSRLIAKTGQPESAPCWSSPSIIRDDRFWRPFALAAASDKSATARGQPLPTTWLAEQFSFRGNSE